MGPVLNLGVRRSLDGARVLGDYELPAQHLTTHGVIVGMTGSGKTGLVTVLVEEALRAQVPVLLIDVKGDLPNLCLRFPSFDPALIAPWVEPAPGDESGIADPSEVARVAAERKAALLEWSIDEARLADYVQRSYVRVVTPGADAGEMLHVLSGLERRSPRWETDPEGARASLSAAVSLLLRLAGRAGQASLAREHTLLSVLAEARARRGESADLASLVSEVVTPGVAEIGTLPVDEFLSPKRRRELAADIDSLLASPSMAAWRTGQSIDIGKWMEKVDGRTPATVVSVAHLDDEERMLVLGVLFHEVLAWVRGLPGTSRLRALVVMDEVYGFVPPHPASPPTKKPLVALMKQARAYGVGCVLATQNPMDLDYRALSNAGLWCLGRLQTDADRDRVLEGLGEKVKGSKLGGIVSRLAPRWFVTRDAMGSQSVSLLGPRTAMSFLRGPMTRGEIRRARGPG